MAMSATDRSNEGKACEAVLRHIEAREQTMRHDLVFPEKAHIVGHIQPEEEAKRHFQPITGRVASQLPVESRFELEIPAGAMFGH